MKSEINVEEFDFCKGCKLVDRVNGVLKYLIENNNNDEYWTNVHFENIYNILMGEDNG